MTFLGLAELGLKSWGLHKVRGTSLGKAMEEKKKKRKRKRRRRTEREKRKRQQENRNMKENENAKFLIKSFVKF